MVERFLRIEKVPVRFCHLALVCFVFCLYNNIERYCEVLAEAASQPHKLEVGGSSPPLATIGRLAQLVQSTCLLQILPTVTGIW